MLEANIYYSREYGAATVNPTRPRTLEEELLEHIPLGHLDPFWMNRLGIARVDLDKWKSNNLPIDGIHGIVEVIYQRLNEPASVTSKRIADSGVVMTNDEYKSYLVKNLIYIGMEFPSVKIRWERVMEAFPAARDVELNLEADDRDKQDKYARSEKDLFLLE